MLLKPNIVGDVGTQQLPYSFNVFFTFGILRWLGIEGKYLCGLNGTHLVQKFNVLHSRKSRGSNVN
jgi:hypothetical protein